jgi:hypothetical protein
VYKRQIWEYIQAEDTSKLISWSEKALDVFFKGVTNTSEGRVGITTDNLALALHAGAENLSQDKNLKKLLVPNISLGQRTLLPGLYAQATATLPHNVMASAQEALGKMFIAGANHRPDYDAYTAAVRSSILGIKATYPELDFSIDAWTTIKHDMTNANIVPLKSMEKYYLPGELNDPRVVAKGSYALGGTREFIGSEILAVAKSNKGLSGRVIPVGATPLGHQIQETINAAYSTAPNKKLAASSSVVAATLYKSSFNEMAGRIAFGDSQFYLTDLGRSGLAFDHSPMRSIEKYLTRDELVSYFNQIRHRSTKSSGDKAINADWDEFINAIQERRTGEGFHKSSRPLKLPGGKVRREKVIRVLTSEGKYKNIPGPARGTTHLSGVQLSGFDAERKIAFEKIGSRDVMPLLVGSGVRATAAVGMSGQKGMHGAAEKSVHLVSGMESLTSQNLFNNQFHHRLNMLALPGVREAKEVTGKNKKKTAKKAGNSSKGLTMEVFVKKYKTRGGKGLEILEGQIIDRGIEPKEFLSISDKIFKEHGISSDAVNFDANEMFKLMKNPAAAAAAEALEV